MGASISVSNYNVSTGLIEFVANLYGESDAGDRYYLDVKNYNSSHYVQVGQGSLSNGASEQTTIYLGLSSAYKLFTGTKKTFRIRWNSSSGTTSVTLPLSYTPPSYTIPERPMQQTQHVTYNGVVSGEAGCCVANATSSSIEVLKMRTGNTVYNYSVGWIYGGGGDGYSEEMQFDKAFNFLLTNGSPPAQVLTNTVGMNSYPDIYYQKDAKNMYNQNYSNALKYATPQRIKSWRKISDDYNWNLESVFNAVKRENTTVLITFNINKAFDDAYKNGWVGEVTGTTRGGHCCIVLGWVNNGDKYYWVVQNSWTYSNGSPFGDKGIYYIPFDFFNYDGCGIWDFYELIRDDSAPVMPNLPDNVGMPKITSRTSNGFVLSCNTVAMATNYEFRYRRNDSSTYSSKTSTTNTVTLSGLDYGYTYLLSVRYFKNGVWSPYSQESEGTVLPDYPSIESVYSTTPTNLIVKLKTGSMSGKYSYVEIWRRYAPWVNTNSNIDSKKVYNLDALTEWTGLTTGNKFAFACVGMIVVNGTTLQSYYRSTEVEGVVGNIRPPFFSWDTPKVKGQPINVTANEWKKLTNNINEMLKFKGKTQKTFTTVTAGVTPITKAIFDEARSAITYTSGLGSSIYIPYAYSGSSVTAEHFNKLVESLNSVT